MAIVSDRAAVLASWPSCYMCDREKTSREHIPPVCFFPEEKDEKGISLYRKNLITVPSCDEHNTEKSGDDVYAVLHLAGTIRGNHCASLIRTGVIARTLRRDQAKRGGRFTGRIVKQFKGVVGENVYGEIDATRIVRFLEFCARGLYFYEKLKPLKLPLRVANLDYDLGDKEKAEELKEQRESFAEEMVGSTYRGDNPDVFRYAICEKAEKDVVIVHMIFYDDLHRWAFYTPNSGTQVL